MLKATSNGPPSGSVNIFAAPAVGCGLVSRVRTYPEGAVLSLWNDLEGSLGTLVQEALGTIKRLCFLRAPRNGTAYIHVMDLATGTGNLVATVPKASVLMI
eukprot:992221_1